MPFVAFGSKKKADQIVGRLDVRRIPELHKKAVDGQATLFDTHRYHAFFTTSTLSTVDADKTHRQHAIIENLNADMKASALAHFPSVIFSPEECMQHVRDGSYALGKRVVDAVTLCCPLRQRKVIYESPTRADAKFSGRVLDGAWR